MRSSILRCLVLSAVLLASAHARAQCGTLDPRFHAPGIQPPGTAYAMTVFDSGSGPELYVGGSFTTAGGVAVSNIVRWDGTSWHDVGGGCNDEVRALFAYDDGSGAKLYVGGEFTLAGGNPASCIASWDGATWSPLGTGVGGVAGDYVHALHVFDNGAGPELWVGGRFLTVDGMPAGNVTRWSFASQAWISTSGLGGQLNAFALFDDGGGVTLYAGGIQQLKRWNGAGWNTLGISGPGFVGSLCVFDAGHGPALYVGGTLTLVNGFAPGSLQSWNGTSWTTIIAGAGTAVSGLAVHEDGNGPALFISGYFPPGANPGKVRRWNGIALTELPALLADASGSTSQSPYCLAVFDEGSGPALFAGGTFDVAGGVQANAIARWKSGAWSSLGTGAGLSSDCVALLDADLGAGPKLFAGGQFNSAGPTGTTGLAVWNGSQWSSVGGGVTGTVTALGAYDPGAGEPSLVVSGFFTAAGGQPANNIARWNGTSWSSMGSGLSAGARCLLAFDDGSGGLSLFAGGSFASSSYNVAKWDGLGWTVIGALGSVVDDLVAFDTGSGPRLCAAGTYYLPDTDQYALLQVWDGSSWTVHGVSNFALQGNSALVADLGNGPRLYVAGQIVDLDGTLASHIASWDGTTWSALGSGLNGIAAKLALYDDGSGPALYVSGDFTQAGGMPIPGFARWDGSQWSAPPFTPGVTFGSQLRAFRAYDDGSGGGADLYLGGSFTALGGIPCNYVAALVRCPDAISPFCYGDGGAADCPCGNHSTVAGRGCANFASDEGAQLTGSGSTSPDTIVLNSEGEGPSALTIFLQGSASAWPGVNFGDGLRCIGGNLKRMYTHSAVGGVVSAPVGADPSITERSAALGDLIQPGDTRYYQAWYRDPNAGFCPAPAGNTWNVSSGLMIRW